MVRGPFDSDVKGRKGKFAGLQPMSKTAESIKPEQTSRKVAGSKCKAGAKVKKGRSQKTDESEEEQEEDADEEY
jgi:hypothetical protein